MPPISEIAAAKKAAAEEKKAAKLAAAEEKKAAKLAATLAAKEAKKAATLAAKEAKKAGSTAALSPADILLFTQSSKGKGRGSNDGCNKRREAVLLSIVNETAPLNDPVHSAAWMQLARLFKEALVTLGGDQGEMISVKAKGGRGSNYDFLVTFAGNAIPVEFKYGAKGITSLPQFVSLAANKEFHNEVYAKFFYDNYLPQTAALYGLTVPPEDIYLAEVHQNTGTHAFFEQAYNAEKAAPAELNNKKSAIVSKSIAEFLSRVSSTTRLNALTAEFQRSQAGKKFLLFHNGAFYHDSLKPTELIAKNVIGVRNGNLLVVQTEEPGTTIKMLLRWKNHLGILYPAWQTSLVRTC